MKKFFSSLAIVAFALASVYIFSSCSNDDDEEIVKHTFTYSAMLYSDNGATRENSAFIQKQQSLRILSEIGKQTFTATDKEAKVTWEAVKNQYREKMLEEVQKLCEEFDDNQIYIQISISRDNLPWDALICRGKQ